MSSKIKLINDLTNKFNVLGEINLSSDEKNLFENLQKLKKDHYNENDRILIIQGTKEIYNFLNTAATSLVNLEKFLSILDIPHHFVFILSPNTDIAWELSEVSTKFSTESSPIHHFIYNDSFEKISNKSDTFCPLPWMHLYVGTDGNVLPCCVSDQSIPMGNILTTSIENIINSKKFIKIRNNMLNDLKSPECAFCYDQEKNNQTSPRENHVKKWFLNKSTISDTITDFKPLYLDIRISNVCNLKCRMCSGYFSSAIAQEDKDLFGNTKWFSLKNNERTDALANILKYLPFVESLYFAGGEPLLMVEHYKILDELIALKKTDVKIKYNTNLTNIKFKNQTIDYWWNKFKNITVGASLDAYDNVAEYVRHGTIWNDVVQNRLFLKEKCPNIKFNITSTVGFLNVESLINLQQTWIRDNLINPDELSMSMLNTPDYLNCQSLPNHHKERLKISITKHIEWCYQNNYVDLVSKWKNVIDFMMLKDQSHMINEFKLITKILDKHRKEEFNRVFPEYSDLL